MPSGLGRVDVLGVGMRRIARAVVLALAVAGLAWGCGSDTADTPSQGGTLIDAEDSSPAVLNPLLVQGLTAPTQHIASNILQGLLTSDETGAYVPQLATAVPSGADVREGPTRVTFRLRPEARWSDGPPVTSADVVFTWRTMMDPGNAVASRSGWDRIRAIEPGRTAAGASCPRATCLTVTFTGDYAPWRDVFSVSAGNVVLPRHVLKGADFDTVWNTAGLVGSGPYTLQSFTPGERAVLVRDPDWWGAGPPGGASPVARIVFDFRASPAAALAAVREGEAQMAGLAPDPDLIARARTIPDTTVASVPSLFFEHVILNTAAAPLDDPLVRQALAYSIDRGQIVDVLLDGSVPVLQSIVREGQFGATQPFARYGYDPGRAAALLTQAGWTRDGDGVFAKDGRPLRITLLTDSGKELRATTARLIAQQARAAGILIVPRQLPIDRLYEDLGSGGFSAAMAAFGGPVDPSLTGLLASNQIPTEENRFSGQNVYRWSDAEADGLMRRSDREVDEPTRAAALARLQDLVADQVPLIPLYQQPNTVVHTTALSGVRENPTQVDVFWNSGTWSLEGTPGG